MNSGLQCLSNTYPLTRFFLEEFEPSQHVNYSNPIGHKGRMAIAYAGLIQDLWHESSEYPTDVASLLEQLPTENINSVFQYICAPTLIEGAKWSL